MKQDQKERFKNEIQHIDIPAELSIRVRRGINKAQYEHMVPTKAMNRWILMAAAVSAITLISFWYVNDTFARNIKGYFSDIVNRRGAVIQTAYEQATNEIKVKTEKVITEDGQTRVPLEIKIVNDKTPPYSLIEYLTLGEWEILQHNGTLIDHKKIMFDSDAAAPQDFEISDTTYLLKETESNSGRSFAASFVIPEDIAVKGNLILRISSFYGHSKADAPLEIKGTWEVTIPYEPK